MVLPIGMLLEMWRAGMMTVGGPDDEDRILVIASAGSPLSGSGWFRGVRPATGEEVLGNTRGDPRFPPTTSGELTRDCIEARSRVAELSASRIGGIPFNDLLLALRHGSSTSPA